MSILALDTIYQKEMDLKKEFTGEIHTFIPKMNAFIIRCIEKYKNNEVDFIIKKLNNIKCGIEKHEVIKLLEELGNIVYQINFTRGVYQCKKNNSNDAIVNIIIEIINCIVFNEDWKNYLMENKILSFDINFNNGLFLVTAIEKNPECIEIILLNGADVRIRMNYPIQWAYSEWIKCQQNKKNECCSDDLKYIDLFYKHGADINVIIDQAVQYLYWEIIQRYAEKIIDCKKYLFWLSGMNLNKFYYDWKFDFAMTFDTLLGMVSDDEYNNVLDSCYEKAINLDRIDIVKYIETKKECDADLFNVISYNATKSFIHLLNKNKKLERNKCNEALMYICKRDNVIMFKNIKKFMDMGIFDDEKWESMISDLRKNNAKKILRFLRK